MRRAAWGIVLAALLAGCVAEDVPDGVRPAATLPPAALGRPATLLFEENVTASLGAGGRTLPERGRDVFPACPATATGILLEMRWRDASPAPSTLFLEALADGRLLARAETTADVVRLELASEECTQGPLRVRYGVVDGAALDARVTLGATAFLDGPPDWSYSGLPRE